MNELAVLNTNGFECRKELLYGCGKKHFGKRRKPYENEKKRFVKCVNKKITKCDQDNLENKLLEKYISLKAEKSQKKK